MFVRIKFVTTTTTDVTGQPLTNKTQTYYLLDGQIPDEKTTHPVVQKQYKELYDLQEQKSLEIGYPVTVFELFGLSTGSIGSIGSIVSNEQN